MVLAFRSSTGRAALFRFIARSVTCWNSEHPHNLREGSVKNANDDM